MQCDLCSSIPDWLIEHPESEPVFREFGLDTNCGGKSLEYVCMDHGLDPAIVLKRLRQIIP